MSHNNLHITITALILPTIVVAIAPRLGNIPGPSSAIASPGPETEQTGSPVLPTRASLSEAQRAAIAHRESLLAAQPSNPFHYPIPQNSDPNPYPDQQSLATNSDPIEADAPPTMLITSISSARGKGIAIINGTLRREGDSIAEGWTITSINPTNRTVTIQHSTGATRSESQDR